MTYYLGGSRNHHSAGNGQGGWDNAPGYGDTHGGQENGDGGIVNQMEYGDGEGGDLKGNGVSFTHNDPALIFEDHSDLQNSVMLVALMPLIRRRLK